jgi:type I restriction enzyme R subunit
MQQALEYAEILDVPFAYSCNGDAFLEHNRTAIGGEVTREIPLDQFPGPEELRSRYCAAKGWNSQQMAVSTQDYYNDGSGNPAGKNASCSLWIETSLPIRRGRMISSLLRRP